MVYLGNFERKYKLLILLTIRKKIEILVDAVQDNPCAKVFLFKTILVFSIVGRKFLETKHECEIFTGPNNIKISTTTILLFR